MLHYLACATIAYFLARYLNTRFPGWVTAVWSGGVSAIVGIVVGSGLVLGGVTLMGFTLDPGAVAGSGFAQAIIWSVVGAAAGIYHGRQKATTGEHGDVTSIPVAAWLGWGALSIAVVFGAIALMGKISAEKPSSVGKTAPAETLAEKPSYTSPPGYVPFTGKLDNEDKEGKPCTQITEFLGECKRQSAQPVEKRSFSYEEAFPQNAAQTEPAQQTAPAQPSAQELHLQRIYAAHPDADALFTSQDFKHWIVRNAAYRDIPTSGTTEQVIEMFSAFRRWRQAENQRLAAENARKNDAAAEALARRFASPYDRR